MKLSLIIFVLYFISGFDPFPALALNDEAKVILDLLYEEGRAGSEEELMKMLVSIAGDKSLSRSEKIKEMNFVLYLGGSHFSEQEKLKAHEAAFEVVVRDRIEDFLARHPELEEKRKEAIRAGRLEKGMSKEEVVASLGEPEKIKKVLRRSKFDERWDYYRKRLFVYFVEDKLGAWANSGS
ncbi:MAG: hypothetical protein ACE5FZ_09150 [Nitrospiria bacterium]